VSVQAAAGRQWGCSTHKQLASLQVHASVANPPPHTHTCAPLPPLFRPQQSTAPREKSEHCGLVEVLNATQHCKSGVRERAFLILTRVWL
jgi:hypothetical protein